MPKAYSAHKCNCTTLVVVSDTQRGTRLHKSCLVYMYLILYICKYNLYHSNPGIALISLIYLFVKLKALFSLFISCIIMCQYPLDIAPGYCGRYCTRLMWCGVGPLKATYRLAARQFIDGPMRRRPAISQVRYWLQWHSTNATLPLAVSYKGCVSSVCNMRSRGDTSHDRAN